MTVPAPGHERPRMLFPDWVWAIACWATGAGYFLLTVAVGTTFFFPEVHGPSLSPLAVWGTVATITAQALALVWATRYPLIVFWCVFVFFQCSALLTIDRALLITPALLFSVFTLTGILPPRRWRLPVAFAVGADLTIYLIIGAVFLGGLDVLSIIALAIRVLPPYAFAILAGLFYASQRNRAVLEAERREALGLAAESTRAAAVAAERARIAREFHDLAAHHLSSVVVHSKAALNLDDADRALTRIALESIRDESQTAISSMREVVGMLRDVGGEGMAVAVAPGLRDSLNALIESTRSSHQTVEVEIDGAVDTLSAAAALACFRIVQESLSNARKHAPGAAVIVRVVRDDDALTVSVVNARPLAPSPDPANEFRPGWGIVGMRERASVLGGSFSSERRTTGEWETRATIPLELSDGS